MIHILLPVYNRRQITVAFVKLLTVQTYQDFHLVLIDDGSNDGTEQAVKKLLAEVTVIKGRGKWWWGGSLHVGYLYLKKQEINTDDIVIIFNDDSEIDKHYLYNVHTILKNEHRVLLLPELFSMQTGKFIETGVFIDWGQLNFKSGSSVIKFNAGATRGTALRTKDFLSLRGFYPRLLPHYLSDYEFTNRAYRRSFRIISNKKLKLRYNEETTGCREIGGENLWQILRNMFSPKNPVQPIYFINFIILACPFKYIPINVLRVVKDFFKRLAQSLRKKNSN